MILERILAHKRAEVAERKQAVPLDVVRRLADQASEPRGFRRAIQDSSDSCAIVAEVKIASPSRGVLLRTGDPIRLAQTYEEAGATCISVVTDQAFFQGSYDLLRAVRSVVSLPVLAKDFVLDEYQIAEASASGADAVLLIASALNGADPVQRFSEHARSLGMDSLLEVHSDDEAQLAAELRAPLVGINNRELASFEVDLSTTQRLMRWFDDEVVVVSESGVSNASDVVTLASWGANAVLVGEALITAADPGALLRELRG